MDSSEIIFRYFSDLSTDQKNKFDQLAELYADWNSRINLISRKDINNLYTHHILHSLGVAKIIVFKPDTRILDFGTGGGLPGIPLSILFPEVQFHLVDSTKKKITVVQDFANQLALSNVKAEWARAEDLRNRYDFVLGRAVTSISQFLNWCGNKIGNDSRNTLKNGILYLKGGEFEKELKSIRQANTIYSLSDYFSESFYQEKKVIHLVV